jgi:hypothetical protein
MKGLKEHLQKSEIEYIAKNGGGYPQTFQWDENIEDHIKRIGFTITEHFKANNEWIRTKSNICICLEDGYITN